MKKLIKAMIIVPIAMVIMMALMVVIMMKMDHAIDYDVSTENTNVPQFTRMDIPFQQKLNPDESLPFMGSAIIDVDNDGKEELSYAPT